MTRTGPGPSAQAPPRPSLKPRRRVTQTSTGRCCTPTTEHREREPTTDVATPRYPRSNGAVAAPIRVETRLAGDLAHADDVGVEIHVQVDLSARGKRFERGAFDEVMHMGVVRPATCALHRPELAA